MRNIRLTLFVLLAWLTCSFANKDHAFVSLDTLQNRSLKSSDLIFLGKLIGIDSLNFSLSFYILEEFKGHVYSKSITINYRKNDPNYFIDKSLWLVYVNQNIDSSFVLNSNKLTRSIRNPDKIPSYKIPPPPPLKYEIQNITNFTLNWVDFKTNALCDWYAELELLRDFKRCRIENIPNKWFEFKNYFYISIVLNMICIIMLALIMIKKTYRL